MKKRVSAFIAVFILLITSLLHVNAASASLGDVDGNNEITAADARLALRASVGLEKLSEDKKKAADADKNGSITAADARLILRASVGLENLNGNENLSDISDIKIGFILLHDENSTYDLNFIQAINETQKQLGLTEKQIIIKTNIPENYYCYYTACELAEDGCDIIVANSFGHEDFMIDAAKEYPDVQFCSVPGTKAHTEGLSNFHNAYAAIHEGRYLAGIAAGMKLNEMIKNGEITPAGAKMGYVGAFSYNEVISGYTAFYLGAKSVCPTVTMDVKFVGSWYDEFSEKQAARELIRNGCVIISQHSDSMGAPSACANAMVPHIGYNFSWNQVSWNQVFPHTSLISCKINWAPYFSYIITTFAAGKAIATDWCGNLATGSVVLTQLNNNVAAPGTESAINKAKEKLIDGSLKVFDTSTFTVKGQKLTSCMADVNTDNSFTPDTQAIHNGYFHESEYRSYPYFDQMIDGINVIGTRFF